MRRRDILKAFLFSSSTLSVPLGKAQPVAELIEESENHSQFFRSNWSRVPEKTCDSDVLLPQSSGDWCIRDGELLCLVQTPNRLVNLKTHELSSEAKPFCAEMVLRFMNAPTAIMSVENLAGISFGSVNKLDDSDKEIIVGLTRGGHLFIGKTTSDKSVGESILKEKIRLVLTVIPQAAGGCFAKLKALDHAGNTLNTLSSREYQSSEWHGSIGMLSHFTGNGLNGESPSVAISKIEISGEKLQHHSGFEGG